MHIREFQLGDEGSLYAVFVSAVRELASKDYTPEQIEAWAPASFDREAWAKRLQSIRPFVVESNGRLVAYADVQPTGYIDHFFVSGPFARTGIGTLLMNRIHETAISQGIGTLTSDVSRTAQPFFARFGFVVVEQRAPVVRGVMVPNALMRCELTANSSSKRTDLRPAA
jgi:putative acetyltransferase